MKRLGEFMHPAMRLALLFALAAPGLAAAQNHPDLSGTWKLNAARSDYGDMPGAREQTDVIEQSGSTVRESIVSTTRNRTQTYVLSFPTDGQEVILPEDKVIHMGPASLRRVSAVWRGDQLIVTQRVEFQDEKFVFPSAYSLSADGRTLSVKASLGRDSTTMVFEKVVDGK
ncbi:hypothetical protein [Caulobacter sp. S45]|uniref:hypothetical protein n=1 Tax=Caulobacter sp. S45 TaxID=1641861 RepID=UPI00131E0FC2|nr:hypothetical protein [Caulobacter sp. S45]